MINQKGYWLDKNSHEHKYDLTLNKEIINLLKELDCNSVIDLGCGPGIYSKEFVEKGFDCQCYDGNPNTPEESNNLCSVLDLSEPFYLNRRFDCVLSLEVGEHIPKQYENVFIENVLRHAYKLIIISWATIGQGGYGHVNEQPNDYIESLFIKEGYKRNLQHETRLRTSSYWWWFKNTIMVFEKI